MIKKSLCVALSGLILSAAAVAAPLELETQGSFAIGGSVVQKPGTFSEDHFLSPEGQKAYGITPMSFIKFRLIQISTQSSFSTAEIKPKELGRVRLTEETVSRTSYSRNITAFT